MLIITPLVAGGGFLIIKSNSRAENVSNDRSNKKKNKPTLLPKDNPHPKPNKLPQPNPIPKPDNPPQQNNNEYSAITATGQEPEYRTNPPLPISSVGTGNDRPDLVPPGFNGVLGHLTAGSALLTDTLDGEGNGSSILNSKGITHIIHAANQPFSSFNNNEQWYINYIVKSVQNSIILADRNNFKKLVIPLVGGGIYLGSCDPQKLAEGIIRGAVNQLEKCQSLKGITLMDWKGNSKHYFLDKIKELESEFSSYVSGENPGSFFILSNQKSWLCAKIGDIRNKNLHGASVIVNAANTQVKFGSGISGAIAEQVGER